MYPNLYYAFRDLFGIEPWPALRFINTFGFFVALSFVAAHWAMSREMRLIDVARTRGMPVESDDIASEEGIYFIEATGKWKDSTTS